MEVEDLISWEDFQDKQYYFVPTDPDWESVPPGLRLFYEDPEHNPLEHPQRQAGVLLPAAGRSLPGRYRAGTATRSGWRTATSTMSGSPGERAKKYPLLLMSNHGRWRTHAQNDDITWQREIMTCKVRGWDGYLYEPIWINPQGRRKPGVSRTVTSSSCSTSAAVVLGGAFVWERIMPGAVSMDHGARADLIHVAAPRAFLDRGGANNLISPLNGISKNCWGMATSGFLVDVAKVTMAEMEEWREKYPEAFARDYDPAAGLRFDAWVIEGRRGPMSKVFVFDASICNGCYCCQIACKDEHCANDWTPYAKPQPDTGSVLAQAERVCAWHGAQGEDALRRHALQPLRRGRLHGRLPGGRRHLQARRRSGHHRPGDMHGLQELRRCLCVRRHLHERTAEHRSEVHGMCPSPGRGWTEPRCIDACPTGALKFLEEAEAKELIGEAELLHPADTEAARLLQNIPKKFIAGTLYDPAKKEVVIGASLTLKSNGSTWTTTTDGFGDFWFEGLEMGSYDLEITASGFAPKAFAALSTEQDVNLGDVALSGA